MASKAIQRTDGVANRAAIGSICFMSNRPTRAANGAPELLVVRRGGTRCPRVSVPMNATGGVASAGLRECVLALLARVGPFLISAEIAHWRPVGHRRRQRRRQLLELQVCVHRLAGGEGQHGGEAGD